MARNRKTQSAAVRFGPALKALLLCIFFGGAGVGYVWQKNQLHALGTQISQRERLLGELKQQNKMRRMQFELMCSAPELEARIKRLNLGLVQPTMAQRIRLPEPVREPSSPARDQRYAGQGRGYQMP